MGSKRPNIRWLAAVLAVYLATAGSAYLAARGERIRMQEQIAEANLSLDKTICERDDARASARQYEKQYNELLSDYKALERENEDQRHLIEELSFAIDDLKAEWMKWTDGGAFKLTYYCPCPRCCGKWSGGPTATGTWPEEGRTIAVDPNVIPLGSKVRINGHSYVAEDTGVSGKHIDIFVSSHAEALKLGVGKADVRWKAS